MNPIDSLFQRLRTEKRKAFIPFVTAGDPDLDFTCDVVLEVVTQGASLVELGFPYSDPIADGSVIQASYARALSNGIRIDDVLACAGKLSKMPLLVDRQVPLAAMVSFSLIFRRGPERFIELAQASGLSGAIVPDLPVEEAGALAGVAAARDFKLIQLVTPTTPRDRALRIAETCTGFLYCVSVTGITGERDSLPDALLEQLSWLRRQTSLPLCVGFGISKPAHAHMLRDHADGIIVGSAIVRKLEKATLAGRADVVRQIGALTRSLVDALNVT